MGMKEIPENAILVARNMGPAELLEYDRSRLRGVVLEEGGATAHVAIVAKSLGLVAVGQAENIVSMSESGDDIILDGVSGTVHLRPTSDVEQVYVERVRIGARRRAHYRELRDRPSVTRDGIEITLLHNSGLVADLPMLDETGAAGVGLFRTELQFMIASKLPRLNEQVELYREAIRLTGGRPIVFRLLDIGGDKVIPYLRSEIEENPAMGFRSLRLALDRPGLLRIQVRALLQAANGGPLKILVPMVTDTWEFRQTRLVINKEVERLKHEGKPVPSKLEVGAMIEVPSLLWELDQVLPECDFVSIGSNDLMQFMFAADRDNTQVSNRFDALSPASLRALAHIADKATAAGVPVSVCGEMAGRPLEAMTLIALGYRVLSMSPAAIGPVKAMLLALDAAEMRAAIAPLIAGQGAMASLRAEISALARARGVPV
jgi:phosphotransferase system enzyme I (PtsP)